MAAIEQIYQYTYPSSNNNVAVLIDNIPQTYRHLEIIWSAKAISSAVVAASIRLNNDSSTYGYMGSAARGGNGGIYATGRYGLTKIQGMDSTTMSADNNGGALKMLIYDYANTTRYTQVGGITNKDGYCSKFMNTWNNNNAVTSIQFTAFSNQTYGEGKIFINGWNDFANA
tara:strand:+ start:691 stop:1203 length:513 start_codon:yes stop_codon:yes gene_type:complete